jgi:hypothetical protein
LYPIKNSIWNQLIKKLKKEDIGKILNFVQSLDKIFVSLDQTKKKLFLKLLISKIFVRNNNISSVTYTPTFQMVVDKNLVRIRCNWLPVRDLIRTVEKLSKINSILDRNF